LSSQNISILASFTSFNIFISIISIKKEFLQCRGMKLKIKHH
jgi:hypothetical protein